MRCEWIFFKRRSIHEQQLGKRFLDSCKSRHFHNKQLEEPKWDPDVDSGFQAIYTPLDVPASLRSEVPSQNGGYHSTGLLDQDLPLLAECRNLSDSAASSYYSFDNNLLSLDNYSPPATCTVTSATTSNWHVSNDVTESQSQQFENQKVSKSVQNTRTVQNFKVLGSKETKLPNVIITNKQAVKTGIFRVDSKSKILGGKSGIILSNTTNSPNARVFDKCKKFSLFPSKGKVGRPPIRSHTVQTALQKSPQESSEWAVVRHHEISVDGQDKKFPITIIAKKTGGEELKSKPSSQCVNGKDLHLECKSKVGQQKVLKHSCSVCHEPLATRNSLSTHMKSHRLPVCMCCLKVWRSSEHLRVHLRKRNRSASPRIVLVTSKYGRRRNVLSAADL
ncbi:uncharacterized protein LOC134531910 isoform X2 [Bacillus rossius redtenbacheri]|uniref:uncharacterized protein LOC134531910 isoform X2 n=1 Tax=Bacillus rossius redtenbacheri TaxID=93214 RepID=UPI002FDE87BE